MDRATALLDSRDEAERRVAENEQIIAARFCPTTTVFWRGARAAVTWAPDGSSYLAEHGDESIARLAGFRALADEGEDQDGKREPIWMGTGLTGRGTYAAQFEVAVVE